MAVFSLVAIANSDVPSNLKFTALLTSENPAFAQDASTLTPQGKKGIVAFVKYYQRNLVIWRIKTSGLEDATMAHIHCYPSTGKNGPVGVTLKPSRNYNVWDRAYGYFLSPDENNKCGWKTMEDVIQAMSMQQAYVNVHTKEQPAGAIRGDILDIGF